NASRASLDPFPVVTFEFELKLDTGRSQETQTRVVDFDSASAGRDAGLGFSRQRYFIRQHFLDHHQRHQVVVSDVFRVDNDETPLRGEPQLSIESPPSARLIPVAGCFNGLHPIGNAVPDRWNDGNATA